MRAVAYFTSSLMNLRLTENAGKLIRLDFHQGAVPAFSTPSPLLSEALDQLTAYFQGKLKKFDLPLELSGTNFQLLVWKQLLGIPYGETMSYGQIAAALGKPGASRAVGGANNKNPIPIIVPCHRVIGADGSLTGFAPGLEYKTKLLNLEKRHLLA